MSLSCDGFPLRDLGAPEATGPASVSEGYQRAGGVQVLGDPEQNRTTRETTTADG